MAGGYWIDGYWISGYWKSGYWKEGAGGGSGSTPAEARRKRRYDLRWRAVSIILGIFGGK